MIKAAFISVEDEPPDLILSFVEQLDTPGDIKNLILMRTKKYESFMYPCERGVNISWDEDAEEDDILEIVERIDWNAQIVRIQTGKRIFEVDISEVDDEEKKDMKKILDKMNSDHCFELNQIKT